MRKILILAVAGLFLALHAPSRGMAAEQSTGGFFGFKKFTKKSASEAAVKRKAKDAADAELTDEEKKQAKEMADKVPAKGAGSVKANARIPARVLAAPAPRVPQVVAHNAPAGPPKNPNATLLRPPKPPGKAPLVPVTTGPKKTN